MEQIQLSRNFLKKPIYIISILLIFVLAFEVVNWIYSYERKIEVVERFGGILGYLYIFFRGGILPELITTVIIIALINFHHTLFKIKAVNVSWLAILYYELSFLPVLLLAFFFFNPITQSIRYLLVSFPEYDFSLYLDQYLVGTYSWRLYLAYLIPVMIIGYVSINISLLIDFIRGARIRRYSDTIPG